MARSRPEKPLYTVFVGNISYDTTEEQLKQKFSEVGHVVSFRLNYDRETGKPKGFGFCEYDDKEVAMSAIRNLNGEMINGRAVRVDFAGHDKQLQGLTPAPASQPAGRAQAPSRTQRPSITLPEPLSGASPSIATLPLKEIHEIMVQVKAAVLSNPVELRALLVANPQISHALLQGQILLGMVPLPPPPQTTGIPPQAPMVPSTQPGQVPTGPGIGHAVTPTAANLPNAQAMQGVSQYQQVQGTMPVSGVQGAQAMAPIGQSVPQAAPGAIHLNQGTSSNQPQPQLQMHLQTQSQVGTPGIDQQQAAVLQQVMQLTPQQIEQLPPEQRSKVMELRQKVQEHLSRMPAQGPAQAPGQFM